MDKCFHREQIITELTNNKKKHFFDFNLFVLSGRIEIRQNIFRYEQTGLMKLLRRICKKLAIVTTFQKKKSYRK